MPFDELTAKVEARLELKPVNIFLKRTTGHPSCRISIRKALAEQMTFKSGDKVAVAIGTGEDTGKLRLKIGATRIGKVHALKTNAFSVALGYIAAFGDEPKEGVGCDAVLVDPQTVMITLPNWADVPSDDAETDPDEPEQEDDAGRTAPTVMPPTRNGGAVARAGAAPEPVEGMGVTITFHPRSMIVFNKEGLPVTERQAHFLAPLVKAFGNIVLTADLARRMGLPASDGASIVAEEYEMLEDRLPEIGLKLRAVPKMGYSLSKA